MAIPVAILYVSGIEIIVRMLVLQSRIFQSISPKEETIKIPTIIKAGAVTAGVTT